MDVIMGRIASAIVVILALRIHSYSPRHVQILLQLKDATTMVYKMH